MKTNTSIILKVINVLTWIGFIALLVRAGSLIFSYFVSKYWNSIAAHNIDSGLDLSQLKVHDEIAYSLLVMCIIAITIMEALLFYTIIQIFQKINMISPFNSIIGNLIKKMSGFSLIIGIMSDLTVNFSKKYIAMGMNFPNLADYIGHGGVFILFSGILYFISLLFDKGIELQTESELTI